MDDKLYVECECHSPEHTIHFEAQDDMDEVSLSVFLNDYESWYKRVWIAIKYIFGYKCMYGHWDVTLIGRDDAEKIVVFLERNLLDNPSKS